MSYSIQILESTLVEALLKKDKLLEQRNLSEAEALNPLIDDLKSALDKLKQ